MPTRSELANALRALAIDAVEQAAGLDQIGRRLSAARAAAAEELQSKGNLYRTCGIALGILVVLVLI